jgi:hypothetical protein
MITFTISGAAWRAANFDESEIRQEHADVGQALGGAVYRKHGRGYFYIVTASKDTAEYLASVFNDYAQIWGGPREDPEVKAEARVCARAAWKIREAIEKG